MIRAGPNWAERLARLLRAARVSSLLMTFGMLGIMIELWAPGHAVAGIIGVACLLLFAFGHYVVNLAGWETLLLFGAGATLVVVEIFFFPGHGVMVVLGVVLAMLGADRVDGRRQARAARRLLGGGWLPRALTRVFGSLLARARRWRSWRAILPSRASAAR